MDALFGLPNEGIHAARFAGLAANDLLLTAAAAYLISRSAENVSMTRAFAGLWLAGTAMHWVFDVDTAGLRALRNLFK